MRTAYSVGENFAPGDHVLYRNISRGDKVTSQKVRSAVSGQMVSVDTKNGLLHCRIDLIWRRSIK